MRRRIQFDECDEPEEVLGWLNKIREDQDLIEAKTIQNAQEIEALKAKSKEETKIKPEPKPKPKLPKPKPEPKPKKKGKKKMKSKGSALTRVLAILMLVVAITGLCYAAYVPSDITYEIAANPEMLATYLRDVTSTMMSSSYLFYPTTAANAPPLADGRVWYNNTANRLQISLDGTTWTNIDVAGGNSLDAAYDLSGAVTVDGAAITLTVPLAANNAALSLVSNDTTSDPDVLVIDQNSDLATVTAIQIDSVTGYDIRGTADAWYVSYLGVATLPGIILGGTDLVMENADGINNVDDDVIEFWTNDAEDFELDLSAADVITIASDTGIDQWNFGAIDDVNGIETIVFDNAACSLTIDGNTDAHDLTINHTADGGTDDSSIVLASAGTGDDALDFTASVGGIDMDAVKSFTITSVENTTDAIVINATLGGVQILADAAGATEDILLSNTGGSVTVTASEDVTDAINIDATAGGIDIDAVGEAGQDIVITNTGGSVQVVATEAGALDAFNLDVTGAISGVDVDTTNGPIILTAANATNGDITLSAADVMTLTSTDYKMFDGAATEVWRIDGTAAGTYHSISFTDATANVVWTFPDGDAGTYGIMQTSLATNFADEDNSVTGGSNQIIFEGATGGDAHETIIQATDPTADIIWILPDGGADSLAVMGSTLVTNYPEVANSVWGASNEIRFEGAAADAFESVITSADITGGVVTWTLADMGAADILSVMGSTLTTNAVGIANSVWGGTNQLIFEGATDDAHSLALTPIDPTATNTITFPDDTGYIAWMAEAGTTAKDATDAALPLTDAVVCGTSGAASAWSLPNGEEGQILTVVIVTDGGEATITPDTAAGCGWATVVLTDDIDGVTFMYVNDTVGWIILGTFSDGTNIVAVTQ